MRRRERDRKGFAVAVIESGAILALLYVITQPREGDFYRPPFSVSTFSVRRPCASSPSLPPSHLFRNGRLRQHWRSTPNAKWWNARRARSLDPRTKDLSDKFESEVLNFIGGFGKLSTECSIRAHCGTERIAANDTCSSTGSNWKSSNGKNVAVSVLS